MSAVCEIWDFVGTTFVVSKVISIFCVGRDYCDEGPCHYITDTEENIGVNTHQYSVVVISIQKQ